MIQNIKLNLKGKNYMKVLILYFSATGNTAKIAKVIEEKFKEEGVRVTMSEITSLGERQRKIDFESYQAVVFWGASSHSPGAESNEGLVKDSGWSRQKMLNVFYIWWLWCPSSSLFHKRNIERTKFYGCVIR